MIIRVPLCYIDDNPFQPRASYNRDKLDELAASIGRRGLLQPPKGRLVTTDGDMVDAGELPERTAVALLPFFALPEPVQELMRSDLEKALQEPGDLTSTQWRELLDREVASYATPIERFDPGAEYEPCDEMEAACCEDCELLFRWKRGDMCARPICAREKADQQRRREARRFARENGYHIVDDGKDGKASHGVLFGYVDAEVAATELAIEEGCEHLAIDVRMRKIISYNGPDECDVSWACTSRTCRCKLRAAHALQSKQISEHALCDHLTDVACRRIAARIEELPQAVQRMLLLTSGRKELHGTQSIPQTVARDLVAGAKRLGQDRNPDVVRDQLSDLLRGLDLDGELPDRPPDPGGTDDRIRRMDESLDHEPEFTS